MDDIQLEKERSLKTIFVVANVVFFGFYIPLWMKILNLFSGNISENDGVFLEMLFAVLAPIVYSVVTLIYIAVFKIKQQKPYDRMVGIVWAPVLIAVIIFGIKWFFFK
ncbi:MAG: hypothetical protein PSV16_01660 [Flavobacterium sp.]|nr:hypothetical protein [Flavobacterium sp.]